MPEITTPGSVGGYGSISGSSSGPSPSPSPRFNPGTYFGNIINRRVTPTQVTINNTPKPACAPIYNNQAILDALNGFLANIDTCPIQGDKSIIIELVQKELQRQLSIAKKVGENCNVAPASPTWVQITGNNADETSPAQISAKRAACESAAGRIWDNSAGQMAGAGFTAYEIMNAIGSRSGAIASACKSVAIGKNLDEPISTGTPINSNSIAGSGYFFGGLPYGPRTVGRTI
jgi:hypothetical protein